MESGRHDEIEAAVLEAIRAANAGESYPTVDELSVALANRRMAAADVAAAADRLYRSNRVSVNTAGGLYARD